MQVSSMQWVVRVVGRPADGFLEQTVYLMGWGIEPGWRAALTDDIACAMRRGEGTATVELVRVARYVTADGEGVVTMRTGLESWQLDGWDPAGVSAHLPMVASWTGEAGLEEDEARTVFLVRQAIGLEARRQARLWRDRQRTKAAVALVGGIA